MPIQLENAPEPATGDLSPLRRLLPYLQQYRQTVAAAIVFLALAAATTLALPLAVRHMIDEGFTSTGRNLAVNDFLILIIMALMLGIASAGRYYFVIVLGERVVSDLRRDVFTHLTKLSPEFFDTALSGEIISRLSADATQIKSAVGATASLALRNTILATGAAIMMVVTSPKLSALVLIAIPVVVIPIVIFGRSVRRRSREAQDMLAEATAFASEQIGSVRTMQAFTNEGYVSSRYGTAVDTAFLAARRSIKARSGLTFIAIFTIFSSVVGVLWFGSRDVTSGAITPGVLGQFLLYSVLAAGALGSLSEVWGDLSQAAGAAERLSEILAQVPVISAPHKPRQFAGSSRGMIEFDKVDFAYPARPERAALRGLTFSVRPGETVALVGSSGAGKSTIFSMLLRFYDPDQGRIMIDGLDLRELDPGDLRSRIAFVPQDVTIFSGSARDNIRFGKVEASDEEIETAAELALASDFLQSLEKGFDTEVGERGVALSGGQRQRIAIARAILRDAPILLLDEATSALDARSESLVQKALDRLVTGRTTLVIAHRLATVLKADRILVIEDGRIVETGSHESLIAQDGVYAHLAHLQFDTGLAKAAE